MKDGRNYVVLWLTSPVEGDCRNEAHEAANGKNQGRAAHDADARNAARAWRCRLRHQSFPQITAPRSALRRCRRRRRTLAVGIVDVLPAVDVKKHFADNAVSEWHGSYRSIGHKCKHTGRTGEMERKKGDQSGL